MLKLIYIATICANHFFINLDIKQVRKYYKEAATNESSCLYMVSSLKEYTIATNAVMYGYKACATMMMAKHCFNPVKKYNYFKKGKAMLESAIKENSTNVELIFLRYAVQTNIPSFLNYKQHINTDKAFLLSKLPIKTDEELNEIISTYLKNEK